MSTTARVTKIVAEILHVPIEKVEPHTPLYQVADFDSMHLAEIAAAIDDEFEMRLPGDQLDVVQSVEDLVRLVEAAPGR